MGRASGKAVAPYVIDENEAAAFIGVSPKTLQTWRSRRKGPLYVRIAPKCIRYRKADLQAFIDERVVTVQGIAETIQHAEKNFKKRADFC